MSDFNTQNNQWHDDELQRVLQSIKPKAEHAFRENLEAQLMAQLRQDNQSTEDDILMPLFKQEKQKRQTQTSRIPVTLVAAMIAIAIIGGLVILLQGGTDTLSPVASQPTAESECNYEGQTQTIQLQEGDTLFSIADFYEVSIDDLLAANCFEDQLIMVVGDDVKIPVSARGIIPNPVTVFIATEDIEAGEIITIQMIDSEPRMPIRVNAENPVQRIEEFLGRPAVTSIEAGTIIETTMISQDNSEAQIPIIVARYDLALSHIITEDDVVTVLLPRSFAEQLLSEQSDGGFFGATEQVVGQATTRYIPQFEPIYSDATMNAMQCSTNEMVAVSCRLLEEGHVAITLPFEDSSVMLFQEGQQVDVITATLGVDADSNTPQPTLLTIASDARILMINGIGDGLSVTIEVEPEIAEQLSYFVESLHDLRIVPHVEGSEVFNAETIPVYPTTADGLVGVAIPFDQLSSNELIDTGYVSDVTISLTGNQNETPEIGELFSSTGMHFWQIHQAPIMYIGYGEGAYQNPFEDSDIFAVIGVQPIYAQTVASYVQQGARFSLNNLEPIASTYEIEIVGVDGVGNREAEVVTIRNNGRIVDMTDWTLQDSDGNVFIFGELMFFEDSEYQIFTIHGIDTPNTGYWGQGEAIFSSNETITLYNNEGRIHDVYTIP